MLVPKTYYILSKVKLIHAYDIRRVKYFVIQFDSDDSHGLILHNR